jgi:hypothetical protein
VDKSFAAATSAINRLPDDCLIVVAIHQISIENPSELDNKIRQWLLIQAERHFIVLLTGHLHNNGIKTLRSETERIGKKVLHVRTSTSNKKQARASELASFASIQFLRQSGKIIGCSIRRVKFEGEQGWRFDPTNSSLKLNDDGWSEND